MEKKNMTNKQYEGIIRLIIKMIRDGMPRDEIIEYLEKLIEK